MLTGKGMLITTILMLVFVGIIMLILSKIKMAKKILSAIKEKVMWSPVLRSFIQTYFESCIFIFVVAN